MGRKIRSTVPQTNKHLVPKWPYLVEFRKKNEAFKGKQKENFDRRHRARDAPEIPDDAEVWVTTGKDPVRGRVVSASDSPRSYIVDTPTGEIRRNQSQLNIVPPDTESLPDASSPGGTSPTSNLSPSPQPSRIPIRIPTRSQTGTSLRPPDYLRY